MKTKPLKKYKQLMFAALLFLCTTPAFADVFWWLKDTSWLDNHPWDWGRNFCEDVFYDYSGYYSPENLPYVGGVLLTAGIMANTHFDRSFEQYWQTKIRSEGTDEFFKPYQTVGYLHYKKSYLGAIFLGYCLEHWQDSSYLGYIIYNWGYRSFRAMLIVGPQVTFLRSILGGGRPNGYPYSNSKWRLFVQSRPSCSGHTFNGALPFISAGMMFDNPVIRYSLYAISTLPGLARINNNKHYFSQVFLGWALAFLAVKNIDESDKECNAFVKINFCPCKDGAMALASFNF